MLLYGDENKSYLDASQLYSDYIYDIGKKAFLTYWKNGMHKVLPEKFVLGRVIFSPWWIVRHVMDIG